MIIGITGTLGAGKGTVVEYLVEHKGFKHYSARALLLEEINRRGMPVNRDSMLIIANEYRARSPGFIPNTLMERAQASGGNAVVEALRSVGEIKTLKQYPDSYVFAVDADPRIRYERAHARKSETDDVSFETFMEQERRENESDDPNIINLRKSIEAADFRFENNGTKEELFAEVQKVLEKITEQK